MSSPGRGLTAKQSSYDKERERDHHWHDHRHDHWHDHRHDGGEYDGGTQSTDDHGRGQPHGKREQSNGGGAEERLLPTADDPGEQGDRGKRRRVEHAGDGAKEGPRADFRREAAGLGRSGRRPWRTSQKLPAHALAVLA